MSIFVTGGAGFIGSNLIKLLNIHDLSNIYVVDRLRSNGKWKNLLRCKFIDLIDSECFNVNDISTNDVVVHLGACSNTKEQDADFLWKNNVKLTKNIIDRCVAVHARLIYASSAAVYGNGEYGFKDDNTTTKLIQPLNPYGFSKLKVDEYVIDKKLESKVCGLRFFNVWGVNEEHKGNMRSFPSRVKEQFIKNKPVTVYTSGTRKLERDFIYVDDVCEVIKQFITNPNVNGIFNVGTGEANTWMDIATTLQETIGVSTDLITIEQIPADLERQYQFSTVANVDKLLSTFKDFKFTPFKESLIKFAKLP